MTSPPPHNNQSTTPETPSLEFTILVALFGVVLVTLMIVNLIIFVCFRKRNHDRGPLDPESSPTPPQPPTPPHDSQLQQIFYPPYANYGFPMPWNILPSPPEDGIHSPNHLIQGNIPVSKSCGNFRVGDLALATAIFAKKNIVGEGAFGCVYKGLLPNGRRVAIRWLNKKGLNLVGEHEFVEEVDVMRGVHHKHLVKLVGYCVTSEERFLVHEFFSNNTLDFHLHGKDQPILEWANRMKIAIGCAKGLAYLHEDCDPVIVHGSFRASNILIDSNFEAKVADFGLNKLVAYHAQDNDNDTQQKYRRPFGNFGYISPNKNEREMEIELKKEDVFSYGVMLLELITGCKPNPPLTADRFLSWGKHLVGEAVENKIYDEVVDPRLQNNYNIEEMAAMVVCAAACLHDKVLSRLPVSQIILILEGDLPASELEEELKSTWI